MNRVRSVCLAVGVVVCWAAGARGQVQTFINDFDGWAAATGAFSTIDFETLPDGSPSVVGTDITDAFNYTTQGAMFSSPQADLSDLLIGGNSISGFDLRTVSDGTIEIPAFIRGDLTIPARSVGFFFPGDGTLEAFDEMGLLLASEVFASSGSGFFLGVVTDAPIAYVVMDEVLFERAAIESFHFASVPEPGRVALLLVGGLGLLRRRGRKG
jgi:hypothetical protein